ncbi:hypothetical protein C8F04DRAFT_1175547 [Mycena alexandri]|uniref:Uncharacterized protein n=1 Tax=Mycena alexandri TaxID=1745969 RepID=A0AAD6TET6_9AGAR|nr:hypothetical protein C8F04DRAFT_1175547 [Mycena alexandri]
MAQYFSDCVEFTVNGGHFGNIVNTFVVPGPPSGENVRRKNSRRSNPATVDSRGRRADGNATTRNQQTRDKRIWIATESSSDTKVQTIAKQNIIKMPPAGRGGEQRMPAEIAAPASRSPPGDTVRPTHQTKSGPDVSDPEFTVEQGRNGNNAGRKRKQQQAQTQRSS